MSYVLLFALNDIIKKLASLHVFHDQEKLFGGLNDFVQLNNARVANQFQDMDFSADPLYICDINYFLFLQYFNRHFFPS